MIRRILFQCFLMAIVGGVFLFSSASQSQYIAHADSRTTPQGDWHTRDANGNQIGCADMPEAKGGVLLGYIVPCITHTVEVTTERFSADMITWLQPTMYAFITLVIVLFGVRVMQEGAQGGGGQLHGEGIMLLLKIGLVIGILELIPGFFVPQLYGVMTEAQSVVTDTIGPDEASIKCDMQHYQGANTPMVWVQMDCLLGKLYGITLGTSKTPNGDDRPNMLLGASIFGLMGGFFFGGTFGAILFLTLIGVLWGMFMVVLRTASSFLNAYIFASVMLIISPMFLPLVLMRATANYFEPLWKGILASILLPVLITAYAMFAMLLYDKMLFADDSLLKNIFDNKLVASIQALPKPVCSKTMAGNPGQRSAWSGIAENDLVKNNVFLKNVILPMFTGANDMCLGVTRPAVDVEKLLGDDKKIDGQTPKEIFTKLFQDAVKLFVLSILISLGFKNFESTINQFIGSGAVFSMMGAKGQLENKFVQMQANMKGAFTHAFDKDGTRGGASGGDFITRLPDAMKAPFKEIGR